MLESEYTLVSQFRIQLLGQPASMKRPKRIAVYGGTFDPVHIGHISVAQMLLTRFNMDEVYYVPAYVAPHKRRAKVTSALHRYAMLALATQGDPLERVSTVELDSPERPYTVETLSYFRSFFGSKVRLFFAMGADSWAEIGTWRDWEKLLDVSNLIVFSRPGVAWSTAHVGHAYEDRIVDLKQMNNAEIERRLADNSGDRVFLSDALYMRVSATNIRREIRRSKERDWVHLLSPQVADYITKYELYR